MNQEKKPPNNEKPSEINRTLYDKNPKQTDVLGGFRHSNEVEPQGVHRVLNNYIDALRQDPRELENIRKLEIVLRKGFRIDQDTLDSIKQENQEFGKEPIKPEEK